MGNKKRGEKRGSIRIVGIVLFVVLLLLGGIKLWASRNVQASWFDMNWTYRERIPITNTSGTNQTNFQTQITFDTATPITNSKMLSTCNDIRFTNAAGKLLPYWIEPTTCNTTTTKIWVNIDSIPTTGNQIYIYYGNPAGNAPGYKTSEVFVRDIASASATWPLDDTTSTQSYARVLNPTVSTGRNVLIDGDMETSGIGNWSASNNAVVTKQTTNPHGGTQVLRVARNGTNSAQANSTGTFKGGKAYRVQGFGRSDGSATFRIQSNNVVLFDGTNSTSWQKFDVTFVSNSADTSLFLRAVTSVDTQYAEFDDVTVTQTTIPPSGGTATQLLADGTMEAAGTGSWTASTATLSKQSGTPHSGSQVLRVTFNGASTAIALQSVMSSGNVYRVYGYTRSDGTGIPRVRDSSGNNLFSGTTSTTWQPFDFLVVGSATTAPNIQLAGSSLGSGNYVEYDDVTVTTDTNTRTDSILSTLDGDMEQSGTGYWVAGAAATLSKQTTTPHGGAQVLRIAYNGTNNPNGSQIIFVTGKTYRITGYARSDGTSTPRVGTSASQLFNGTTSTSWQFFDVEVVADTTTMRLTAVISGAGYAEFDDITVTELDPLIGIPTNGVTLGSAAGGHLTNAYSFDGTNDNVNIYSSDLNSAFNPSEGTVVAWAKVSGAGVWSDGNTHRILQIQADGSNLIAVGKESVNNRLAVYYIAGGTTQEPVSSSLGASTSWFQIVVTWSKSSDQVKMYVNGSQVGGTQTGLGTWVGNFGSTVTHIGISDNSNNNPWSGLINDVHLYPRALSASEISDLYGNGTTDRQAYYTENYQGHELIIQTATTVTVGSAATEETNSGAIVWWKFDDATGTTAKDSSQNANNGTLGGATLPTWQNEEFCINIKCLYFDGAASKVTGSAVANAVQSVSFWIRPNTIATQGIINFDGGTHKISTNGSGVISATGFTSPTYYVNGVATTTPTLVQNQWNFVTITTGTNFNTTSSFTVGTDGTNFIKGFIDDVKFFNYALTQAQVNANLLMGARRAGSVQVNGINQKYLSDSLIAYYKLDEASGNPADSSGNAVTLTNNNTTTYVAGKFGNAANFNGSNEYLSTATTLTNSKTISFWVNPASTTDNFINLTSGAYITASSGTISATGLTSPTIYVNGVQTSTIAASSWQLVTVTTATAISANQFEVGRANGSYAGNGTKIDEARVYSRAMSADEVRELSNWAPGPVGWWKMDEKTGTTANDFSGNGNAGTITAATWVAGKYGSALSFSSASSNFVNIPDPSSGVLDPTYAYSISTWVKYSSTTNYGFIVSKSFNADGGYELFRQTGTGQIRFSSCDSSGVCGAGYFDITTTASYNDNNWHHIEATAALNDTAKIYVDGVLVQTSSTITQNNVNTTDPLTIGNHANHGSTQRFNGLIDDVKIYNYARSPQQIQEDMTGASFATEIASSATGSKPNTAVGHWKFDEGYGTTARNSGSDGSTDNGTLTNMASPATATSGWTNSGKYNKALEFDNSNDYVAMPSDVSALKITKDLTLDAWINLTSTSDTNDIIAKWTGTASTSSYDLFVDNAGKLNMKISDGATITTTTGSTTLSTSTWYHVVGVYNPSTSVTLYINGSQDKQTTASIPATLQNSTTIMDIGAENAGTNPFNGMIDEVKVYDSVLTQDEVRQDFNATSAINYGTGTVEGANFVTGAGVAPVGDWEFEEGTGTTTNDSSGQNNTGTWNGTGATHWNSGKYGKAANFNGTDDYLSFTTTITGMKSVSFWVYPATTTQKIMDFDGGTHYISASSGTVSATGFTSPTIYVNAISGGTITANTWNFITVTTGTSFNTTTSMTFGKANGSNFLNGKLDQIKIYNYVRAIDQIAYDYNRGFPIGWWKFDECSGTTAHDSSGNSNTGTITIAASGTQTSAGDCNTSSTAWGAGATGKYNYSLNFDGTDDYVLLTESKGLPLYNTTAFSISAWVKTTDASLVQQSIFAEGSNSSGNPLYRFELSSNKIQFTIRDNSGTVVSVNTNNSINTSWHHVVLVINGSSVSIYKDGVSQALSASTFSVGALTLNQASIGALFRSSAANFFTGQIDDVRVYNYALTQAQVNLLYNNGSAVFYGPSSGTP